MNIDYLKQNLIEFISRHPERLGIDLSPTMMRLVRLVRSEQGKIAVAAYGQLEAEVLNVLATERQRMKLFIRQISGGMNQCAISLEHPTLRIRRMILARMPETDLLEAIRWNFREHVDCPMEEYSVGFTPLPGYGEEGQTALMAYGVAKEAIRQHISLARDLGLKVVSLEPVATALLASADAAGCLADKKFTVFLSMGEAVSYFIVLTKTMLLFSRPLPGVSLEALLGLIARNMNLEPVRVQPLLLKWRTSRFGQDEKKGPVAADEEILSRLDTTIGHFMSQLVIEAQRSIDAFCIMYNVDRVDQLLICGGGIFFPGIVSHLQHSLGVPTDVFDPFASFSVRPTREGGLPMGKTQMAEADMKLARSAYTAALGLALI